MICRLARCRLPLLLTVAALALVVATRSAGAQPLPVETAVRAEPSERSLASQLDALRHGVVSLPVAAVLGALLAFRPRRRGTPERVPAVIHTQIVLAMLGALIMLVVGASLARAFGIVGAAGLIRYRAKIDDPKDAGVMLSTLGIGLAAGVGHFLLAGFACVFILGVLWLVESLDRPAGTLFTLKVAVKEPAKVRDGIERILRRNLIEYELRSSSTDDLSYEVKVPPDRRIDRVSDAITALDGGSTVEWEDKKAKK